jgi:hypothetical protein
MILFTMPDSIKSSNTFTAVSSAAKAVCYGKPCTLGSKEFSLALEIAFSTVGFSPERENHFVVCTIGL